MKRNHQANVHRRPCKLVLLEAGTAKKGDVLGIARIAGIMAAKKTSNLIQLCPLALTRVAIEFEAAGAHVTRSTGIFCSATVETAAPPAWRWKP